MPETRRLTPLGHALGIAAGEAGVVALAEAPERAMVDVRVPAGDAPAIDALGAAVGVVLPRTPRTAIVTGERAALWLSVDQWLVTAPIAERETVLGRLGEASAGRFAAVTDMSDARAVIRFTGEGGREVIMKGAAVDLTTPAHAAGAVRRVAFAGIAAMVHVVGTRPDVIDLYVFRPYADYAWDWIAAAARPGAALRMFGAQDVPPV